VTPISRPSWSWLFEFHCPECGYQEGYRSRSRGFLEKYLLPVLLLRAVRCDRCYHRSYALCSVPVLERVGGASAHREATESLQDASVPGRKNSSSQPSGGSKSDSRVA
jgi:hypothetical protein